MKHDITRGIVSVIVFAVIFFLSGFIIGYWTVYDVQVKAIEFLAAVIGAGCYWIGSRKN